MAVIEEKAHQGVAALKQYDVKVSGIVFMLFCLVAAGAFGIEEMISSSGPGLTIIMLIIFPIIWAWPISNLSAELSSIIPSEGGVYVWAKEALGEFWGFQVGWWETLSIYLSVGTYIVLVSDYTGQLISMTESQTYLFRFFIILIFTVINLFGIREVGKVSTIFSILILIAFSLITMIGFMNWKLNPMIPFIPEGQSLFESIGAGIGLSVWMFCGYECIANVAGEVKNPKVIPKGLLIAMPLIAASYILPTIAGLASVGQWSKWSTGGAGSVGYASVLTQFLSPAFGVIFLLVAIVSQCAIFNTYLAAGSRGFFVLSDDHLSPKIMVKVSKNRGVPYNGVISLALITLLLAQFTFTTLVMICVVFTLSIYIVLSVTAFVLRKKIPVHKRKDSYLVPGGKLGFHLCCALPLIVAALALMINGLEYFVMGLVGTASGPVAYIIFKRAYGGCSVREPKKYPLNLKTKMTEGDVRNLSYYCFIAGGFAFVGSFFIRWYEGAWGSAYYLETYKNGFFSNFEGMLYTLTCGGILVLILGFILLTISKRIEITRGTENVISIDELELNSHQSQ